MKKGSLFKRLSKGKKTRSILISIRLPREDVEELDQIEEKTALRYDWIIRMLVKRFLQAWERKGSVKAPIQIVVMNYGEIFTPLPISIASETSVRMIWKTDANGKNTFVNGNFLSFIGKKPEEMMGDGWLDIVYPDHRKRIFESWKKSALAKENFAYPMQIKRADGTYIWIFSVGVPEFNAQGKLLGYNGSVFEIEPYLERWLELLEQNHTFKA